ncbi:aromatic acid exporter family protein [Isoptericola sp. NPDC057391]|uniref:FUSC family protein n=1 Tax=Isoptericola sp. NPDC057391 TaxID=3346117 RepID=UPI003631FCF1
MTAARRLASALHRAWLRHPRWSLALRGALAAALAWVVAVLAPAPFSEYPYYAPLGAVVATAGTLARSARESLQTVGSLLLGAGIALAADAVLEPGALSVALVVGVALLCAGWRVLGDMGVWVANSALFVLVLGQGQDAEYVGAFAGLVVVGAAIGMAVNLVLPPLPITPSDLALGALRDALVVQLDDLAGWLDDEGPLDADEWERRRHALHPTIEGARATVARAREASRGNPRARRHGERVRSQARRAEVLGTTAEVVDEVVRLLVGWEGTGRDDVALGPRLRPELATALRSFARALRDPEHAGDDGAAEDPGADFARSLDRLRDVVRDARTRSGDDHLVAGAFVVVLRRGQDVLTG